MLQYGDNFIPVIPSEEPLEHTQENPFCLLLTCPCHENQVMIAEVNQDVQNGLLTPAEATRFVKGGI